MPASSLFDESGEAPQPKVRKRLTVEERCVLEEMQDGAAEPRLVLRRLWLAGAVTRTALQNGQFTYHQKETTR